MANDMQGQQKPKYNTARGEFPLDTPEQQPPFNFENVTARVFPLSAHMPALRKVCEDYLNIAPGEHALFEPAISYVYLIVLHYNKMKLRDKKAGWVSQHEVLFAIPLKWRQKKDKMGDDASLRDWAWVCPYIFVDDDFSLVQGREVYGWPKLPVQIAPELNSWIADPRSRSHLLRVDAEWTPSTNTKANIDAEHNSRLLDITCEAEPTFSLYPPTLNSLLNPLLNLPQTIQKGLSTLGDLVGAVSDLMRSGEKQTLDFAALRQVVPTALQYARVVLPRSGRQENPSPDLDFKQITVKQFHDAGDKETACYKALVESDLGITRFHRGGFLGDLQMMYGNPSGGFHIHLYNELGKFIIDTLGLDAISTNTDREEGLLTPILPFWGEVDLQYGKAETICWRAKTIDWQPPVSQAGKREERVSERRSDNEVRAVPGTDLFKEEVYDPSPGVRDLLIRFHQQESQKFHQQESQKFHQQKSQEFYQQKSQRKTKTSSHSPREDLLLHVYTLIVQKGILQQFCHNYLDDADTLQKTGTSFKLIDVPYVYLMVVSKRDRPQKKMAEPVEVAFQVPVWQEDGGDRKPALISPFVFSQTDAAALVDRELNGRPTLDATLESHTAAGLLHSAKLAEEYPVLTVKTEIFPNSAAEPAGEKVLLKISHAPGSPKRAGGLPWFAEQFLKEKENVLDTIGLKQFRDAEAPDHACYQAIVQTSWNLTIKRKVKFIDETPRILLYSYPPTLEIALKLGLESKVSEEVSESGDTPVELQAIDPFTVVVEREMDSRVNLFWRAGSLEWQKDPEKKPRL